MAVTDDIISGLMLTVFSPALREPPRRPRLVLRPLSWLYGAGAGLRRWLYASAIRSPRRLPCPTISIGNLTTGGTGKTPLTIYIAGLLKNAGLAPLIVSRGYRGSASQRGGLVSDGRNILMRADQSGDEPLLMAERLRGVPVVVGRKRYEAAIAAIRRFAPDVILLDDGFQHFQLARDINIVLLDHARPLGNGCLLPAGPLREPLSALDQADMIVFTRADRPVEVHPARLESRLTRQPRFYAAHQPVVTDWLTVENDAGPGQESPAGHRAYAFCGLADNPSFLDSVRQLGIGLAGHRFFRDHHAYTAEDLAALARKARTAGADLLVTSYKDYVKFRGQTWPARACDLAVLDAAIVFKDQPGDFDALLLEKVRGLPDPGSQPQPRKLKF